MSHECSICNRQFDYPLILKLHCRSHTGEKTFSCKFCPKRFSYEAYLIVHKQIHTQNEEFVDGVGNDSLLQKTALEDNTQLHTGQRKEEIGVMEGSFNDNDSDSSNVSLRQDKLHKLVTSTGEFSKGCDLIRDNYIDFQKEIDISKFCNNSSVQNSAQKEHFQLHITEKIDDMTIKEGILSENGSNYQTITHKQNEFHKSVACNEVFLEDCDLNRRFLYYKDEEPLSRRKVREEAFAKKSKLSVSVRNRKKQGSYICDRCDQSFSMKKLLDKHYRIHATEETFVCGICPKAFLYKENLNRHYRIHSNEKPYICNICDRAFSQKYNLNRHNRIHSNEKPFICNM